MKLKKLIGTLLSVIICLSMSVGTVSASDADFVTDKISASLSEVNINNFELDNIKNINNISTLSVQAADDIQIFTIDGDWSDTKKVSWREGNTTAYHTITSRLSNTHVFVFDNTVQVASSYTNKNGTYNDVWLLVAAPDTVFMSAEVLSSPSTGYIQNYNDYYFNERTPRGLTIDEIITLLEDDQLIYIVYNPRTDEIVDFLSVLNPLIASGWNIPTLK